MEGAWGGADLHGSIKEIEEGSTDDGRWIDLEFENFWDEGGDEGGITLDDHLL